MFELADAFAVEICGYAIMSNHFHLVLTVRQDRALEWSDREVAERWLKLFRGPPLVRNWLTGSPQSEAQQNAALEKDESTGHPRCRKLITGFRVEFPMASA